MSCWNSAAGNSISIRPGRCGARRPLRALPENLQWVWDADPQTGDADRVLRLRFGLPPGAYATALIRELIEVGGQLPSGVDTPD